MEDHNGYDATSGFFNPRDKWIAYPKEAKHRLRRLVVLERSLWARIRFIFLPHCYCEIEQNQSNFTNFNLFYDQEQQNRKEQERRHDQD